MSLCDQLSWFCLELKSFPRLRVLALSWIIFEKLGVSFCKIDSSGFRRTNRSSFTHLGLVKGRCHIVTARRGTIHLGDAPRLLLRDGSVHPHCSDALGRHQLVTAVVFGAWGLKTLPFCLFCKINGFLSPTTTKATPEMTYSLKAPSGRLTLAL